MGSIPDFLQENKRVFDRFSTRLPVKFKDTRDDFGTSVHLHNVSAQGVKIITKDRLYLNDSVTLEVEMLDESGPMILRGEVVWAKKTDIGMWDSGLKFHKVVFMNMWRMYRLESGSQGVL